jgi:peptidoglycan/LPS O-acetylase OafA/YrhL
MFPLNFVAWSLFIEMMLSILFFWTSRWKNGSLWMLLALGLTGLIAVRYFSGYIGGGFAWRDAPSGFARGLFGFVAGMLIARYSTGERKVTNAAWLPLLLAGVIMSISPPHAVAYDLAMIVIGMPALVFVSVRLEPLRARPFTIAGDLSYAIYAFHNIVFSTFEQLSGFSAKAPASPILGFGVLALFLAGCWLLDRYYDCPIRRRLTQSMKPNTVLIGSVCAVSE